MEGQKLRIPSSLITVKKLVRPLFFVPFVKRVLLSLPIADKLYHPWERRHPFDKRYGVETSGIVPPREITSDPAVNTLITLYVASQASVIRNALTALGDVSEYAFVDVGCGKGRAILVASEFPFREVIGVELSPALADIARRNAKRVAGNFPDRPRISVHDQNVIDFELPEGKVVLYVYNPFRERLMEQLIEKLEVLLSSSHNTHVFFVYYNPIVSETIDASRAFCRWFAETIPYDGSELGFGPDEVDTVVIWQSVYGEIPCPHRGAGAKIVIVGPEKAGLAKAASAGWR